MTWWRFWERWTANVIDIAEVERQQVLERKKFEKAKERSQDQNQIADDMKEDLRRHREENHFSELVAHVLRGGERK